MLNFVMFLQTYTFVVSPKDKKKFLQLARNDDNEAKNKEILAKKDILKCIQTLYGFQRADVRR